MKYVEESPGVYRCRVCGHGTRIADPTKIRGCLCHLLPPCKHLGQAIKGAFVRCQGCRGEVKLKVFACSVDSIKQCLPLVKEGRATTPNAQKCDGCLSRES